MPVTLLDTAGMRDTADRVEAAGVARSAAAAAAADIVVFVYDAVVRLCSVSMSCLCCTSRLCACARSSFVRIT